MHWTLNIIRLINHKANKCKCVSKESVTPQVTPDGYIIYVYIYISNRRSSLSIHTYVYDTGLKLELAIGIYIKHNYEYTLYIRIHKM